MSARDTALGLIGLGRVRALEAAGLVVMRRDERDALRERVALLEAASLDLAGVALDNRAPADRSRQGVRP